MTWLEWLIAVPLGQWFTLNPLSSCTARASSAGVAARQVQTYNSSNTACAHGEGRTRTAGMATRVGAGRVYQFRHVGMLGVTPAGIPPAGRHAVVRNDGGWRSGSHSRAATRCYLLIGSDLPLVGERGLVGVAEAVHTVPRLFKLSGLPHATKRYSNGRQSVLEVVDLWRNGL